MAWWNILAPVIEPVTEYFKEGQKIKAAVKERSDELKSKALDTKLEGVRNAQESDINMDNNSRQLSGWMDDASFFIFLMPAAIIACIVGSMVAVSTGEDWKEPWSELYEHSKEAWIDG